MSEPTKILYLAGILLSIYSTLIEATDEEIDHKESLRSKLKGNLSKTVSGRYFERQYSKINDYLTGHSDPEEADPNMNVAEHWLNSEKHLSTFLKSALQQFTELSKIGDLNSCTHESYNILFKNDKAVHGRSRDIRVGKDPKHDRVDKVIRQYCMRHSKKCMKVYPENYKRLVTSIKRDDLRMVETFTDAIIGPRVARSRRDGSEAMKIYGDIVSPTREMILTGGEDVVVVYSLLKKLSNSDGEPKSSRKRDQIKNIKGYFAKFIESPCKIYIEHFGNDLFTPATFDSIYFHKVDDNATEFYKAWARFKVCSALIKKQGSRVLRDVIDMANHK